MNVCGTIEKADSKDERVIKNQACHERKRRHKTFYNGFREISKLMHTSRSLREVQQRTVWKATELLNARGALLRILNRKTEQFEVAAAYSLV